MKNHTHNNSNSVCFTSHSKQSGFSLIEIMVAALILSIGILGVVSLQVVGLKGTQQSSMKQQAMYVVQNLTERMRSNRQGVLANSYAVDSNTYNCLTPIQNCSVAGASCTSPALATSDIHNLVCGIQTGTASRTGGIISVGATDILTLLNGRLRVSCITPGNCATGELTIEVNWSERDIAETTAPPVQDSLVVNTRISL